MCLLKEEQEKEATEVDTRNEEPDHEIAPEERPTPEEEITRMNEEDKYNKYNEKQDWNDTSKTLFYGLKSSWPRCKACGGPCKSMKNILRLDKQFHPQRKHEDTVLQNAGLHYEDVRYDTGADKPKAECELRRITLKENKGNVLKTCAQLQRQGNLSGPNRSMAAMVVGLFYEMANRLSMMGKDDTAKRQSHIRTAIIDSCKECLEEPITKHEKHLSQFPKKKWYDLRPESVGNELEAVDEIYRCIDRKYKLRDAISIRNICGVGTWDYFEAAYTKLLRDYVTCCFDQRLDHDQRRGHNITRKAAKKGKITVRNADLFDTELARHDANIVESVEWAMRAPLMKKAFPLDCISRRVRRTSQLEKCVIHLLHHGKWEHSGHRLRIRESIIASISHAANVAVHWGMPLRDISSDKLAVRLKRSNADNSDEATVKRFLEEQRDMNKIHNGGVLAEKYHRKFQETFRKKMNKYAAEEKTLRDDVQWLKRVVKQGVLDANQGQGSNLKLNEKDWKGFEESWYSSKHKELLILSSSSIYYFLKKGDQRSNAFLMKSPLIHVSSSKIDLTVQHAMEIYYYDKTLSPSRGTISPHSHPHLSPHSSLSHIHANPSTEKSRR